MGGMLSPAGQKENAFLLRKLKLCFAAGSLAELIKRWNRLTTHEKQSGPHHENSGSGRFSANAGSRQGPGMRSRIPLA
jgi:hypothetical protein